MYKGLIPFDKQGAMYYTWNDPPDYPCMKDGVDWRENVLFKDELKLVSYQKGRSSVSFQFQSTKTGQHYECTLKQFFQMVTSGRLENNIIVGEFYFMKRGQNYLLECVPYTKLGRE